MNIRASPRKGLNRIKEEEYALKEKKSLFVTKPKPILGKGATVLYEANPSAGVKQAATTSSSLVCVPNPTPSGGNDGLLNNSDVLSPEDNINLDNCKSQSPHASEGCSEDHYFEGGH